MYILNTCIRYATGNGTELDPDYIVWPSPILADAFPCRSSSKLIHCTNLLPRVEPLPRHLSSKRKPSCDVIIRSSHSYSLFLNILLHSIEIFWPRDMGKIIVILDDSEEDRSYAVTLPNYITVIFEELPDYSHLWVDRDPAKPLGVSLRKHGYSRSLWSNFVADRYSSADFIALFDSDQILTGGGQLQLLFDWDVKLHTYKPIFICTDNIDLRGYFSFNYEIFGMSGDIGIGCMRSLPVVLHRDTLPKVRKYIVNYFLLHEPNIYNDSILSNVSIDDDRDYNWTHNKKNSFRDNHSSIVPTCFDRAFASLDQRCKACQFCVFGAYIYTHPEESSRYKFQIIGYDKSAKKLKVDQRQLVQHVRTIDDIRLTRLGIRKTYTDHYHIYRPECTHLHSSAHVAYMISGPKLSEEYFRVAESIIDDGLCKLSLPTDCNYQYCESRGWNYDAITQRKLASNKRANASFPMQFYSNQQAILGWESYIKSPGGRRFCSSRNYALLHHHFEWQQRFETKNYDHFKLRQCRT